MKRYIPKVAVGILLCGLGIVIWGLYMAHLPVSYEEFVENTEKIYALKDTMDITKNSSHFNPMPQDMLWAKGMDFGAVDNDISKPIRLQAKLTRKDGLNSEIDIYLLTYFVPKIKEKRYIGSFCPSIATEFYGEGAVSQEIMAYPGMIIEFISIPTDGKAVTTEFRMDIVSLIMNMQEKL